MSLNKHLAAGLLFGITVTAVTAALLGLARPVEQPGGPRAGRGAGSIVGVTGATDKDGVHYSVAWEQQGAELVPVAEGVDLPTHEALFTMVQKNLALLATRGEDQQAILSNLQAAGSTNLQADRDRFYRAALDVIRSASPCGGCSDESKQYTGSPSQSLGRLVMCIKRNCH